MNIPTIFTQVEFFYSLACYTVILSGTFCAIVRWCHMCHPFDKQGDYFYPARRQMTFFYAATALQLPYVLCPADSGTWFFARSFGILYYPVCFAMLYHRYFQMGKMWRKVSSIFYFLTPFPAARRFVHHCGFPCGGDSSALQTAMGMCRRRHEHPAVHTYDKSRQMAHQEG